MKCPVCNDVRMREVEKDGVMIDVCPDCKGVWLDRGELEKLMSEIREVRPAFNEWYDSRDDHRAHERKEKDSRYPGPQQGYNQGYPQGYPQGHYKHKKKKSVLDVFGDLFD
ncbi:zf-TFIIB domain-containing protein [Paenibacillus sp. M1]|uniref:Zf-TFIIB domain-containing protein n=1 Tax=Paenibacillus haidiansis TaxID=1574488 RepID=A0ABU7VZ17_9BACL